MTSMTSAAGGALVQRRLLPTRFLIYAVAIVLGRAVRAAAPVGRAVFPEDLPRVVHLPSDVVSGGGRSG